MKPDEQMVTLAAEETGGGCECLRSETINGRFALVTGPELDGIPSDEYDDVCMVGIYDADAPHNQPIRTIDMTWIRDDVRRSIWEDLSGEDAEWL